MKRLLPLLAILSLTACATAPDKIAAADVSPLQYQAYTCRQIGAELARIEKKVNALYYKLDKTASNDNAQMGVGLILFWPTLFFLEGGDGAEAAEYARMKGEVDALESVSIQKNCGIKFPEPPKPVAKEPTKEKFN